MSEDSNTLTLMEQLVLAVSFGGCVQDNCQPNLATTHQTLILTEQ